MTLLLALGGSLLAVAPAQAADGPAISVSKTTGLNAAGETITVTGTNIVTGFANMHGVGEAGVYAQIGYLDATWRPSEGAASATRSYSNSTWVKETGAAPSYTVWTSNGDGTANFVWTTTVTKAQTDAKARTGATLAVFTTGAGGVVQAANELVQPISFAPAPPVVAVTQAPHGGGMVTVTGSGFSPLSPGVYVGLAASGASGFYSATGAETVWVSSTNVDGTSGAGRTGKMTAEGTFSVTYAIPAPSTATPAYSIYVSKAHGQGFSDPSQNAIAAISYAAPPALGTPTITVSKTTGLNVAGEKITVTGSGFDPRGAETNGTRPPLAGKFAGAYVIFGKFLDTWKPSESAPSSARKSLEQKWVISPDDFGGKGLTADDGAVAINPDGTFSIEFTVAETDASKALAGNYGIYSYQGSGGTFAAFETYTPLSFAGLVVPPVVPPVVAPTPEVVAAGSFTWGVKSSFRSYITSIAKGAITTTGAGSVSGLYRFGQAAGGSFTAASGVGTSNYSGSVRFTGHDGALDVTIANPVVRVDSASSATLFVTVNGARVAMASLNLSAASKTVNNGAVSYSNAPATLLASGTSVFAYQGSAFYPAGTALDAVSFTIGSPSSAGTGTATIASYVKAASAPPSTPPATTGVTVQGDVTQLTEGGQITITAEGYKPNETGIMIVIYSTPTVLARDLTADAQGRVTWTGTLPVGLTGEHTLTVQGSVDRGVVLNIPIGASARTMSAAGCDVTAANLVWGYKESFRSYVSGSIAHGEWTTSEGASYETPNFIWSDGTGSYDAGVATGSLAFPGAITFTGHGGVLNTTVSNVNVEFVDDATAYLVVDISGTTQAGEAVNATGVRFVELDLSAGAVTGENGSYEFTAVPSALTEEGSAAFGTYEAGTEFDPVTITLSVDSLCGEAVATSDEPITPIKAESSDWTWLIWVGIALIVIVAIIVTIVVVRRRKA